MTEPQNVSGLMDQIHDLRTQLTDAEKRGAVKALRRKAGDYALGDSPVAGLGVARDLDLYADAIERGEATL